MTIGLEQARSNRIDLHGCVWHYWEWGAADAPALLVWHGFAENGRAHDWLAGLLARDYRIIAPDIPGRGLSAWSPDPDAAYHIDVYGRQAEALVDALGLGRFGLIATSMGGHVAMMLAGGRFADRIGHLVLNDVGPVLREDIAAKMQDIYAEAPVFGDLAAAQAWIARTYRGAGPAALDHLAHWGDRLLRRTDDGRYAPHYDPDIRRQLPGWPSDRDRWADYAGVRAPVLLLRAAQSNVVTDEVVAGMRAATAPLRVEVIDGRGHAPAVFTAHERDLIAGFLAGA